MPEKKKTHARISECTPKPRASSIHNGIHHILFKFCVKMAFFFSSSQIDFFSQNSHLLCTYLKSSLGFFCVFRLLCFQIVASLSCGGTHSLYFHSLSCWSDFCFHGRHKIGAWIFNGEKYFTVQQPIERESL